LKLDDDNLNAALASLLPREQRLIAMRQAGATFSEIGKHYGKTYGWAYQQWSAAMFKLKARLKRGARA